jgi:hypothetical protein
MSKPCTDELVESWWKALRYARFDDVEGRIDTFLEKATDTTKFPRPAQFRPPETSTGGTSDDPYTAKMINQSTREWDERLASADKLAKLHMAEALLARYSLDDNPTTFEERMTWLKERVAATIRDTPAPLILKDHRASLFVLQLFGKAGIKRLEQRA